MHLLLVFLDFCLCIFILVFLYFNLSFLVLFLPLPPVFGGAPRVDDVTGGSCAATAGRAAVATAAAGRAAVATAGRAAVATAGRAAVATAGRDAAAVRRLVGDAGRAAVATAVGRPRGGAEVRVATAAAGCAAVVVGLASCDNPRAYPSGFCLCS